MSFEGFELIYSYSRKQALENGVLVDATVQARETGFKLHTAVTATLYNGYILPPEGLEGEGQSVEGRLNDLLWLVMVAARKQLEGSRVETDVCFLMAPGRQEKIRIIAVVGPGDAGEPVLTIMLPGDD